jgi:hypothetical protein
LNFIQKCKDKFGLNSWILKTHNRQWFDIIGIFPDFRQKGSLLKRFLHFRRSIKPTVDAVMMDPEPHLPFRNAQSAGGGGHVAVGYFQGFHDELFFQP